ncbi:GntR family transcriptional regulator [Pengzhenrongella frigida]|uniref:GntR family transcriptional regulator n=1 Tax=Pengzhenrongella frigida TaxID=1259133 RepID=A0A4Q5N4Q3_9MICO|nr:GntR family transcriptional regulator [Cellulomonas sp. HLT2-17]RYV52333.1 GntR family transcriptional regulator [Cellulomonas sp. HLT2-17]
MIPVLDPDSALPPYEQIRSQLVAAIRTGALVPGTRLPTVRALADDLGVATNTVARAYRELEQAGVVQTRGRAGTFVETSGEATERAAFAAAQDYVSRVRALGMDDDGAVRWVLDALRVARD